VIERSGQIILRQSVQMARLLDDLLDVARISTGRFELKFQTSTIEALIATAVETARPRVDAGQHRLIIDVRDAQAMLRVDVVRIAQVIANILDNAAKYMEPPGEMRLEAGLNGDDFVLSVTDQGIGIKSGSLSRVFDMFAQENAPERASGGLGIGLALAKGVVDLHGGHIEAESAGLGQGAKFTLTLPATRATDSEELEDHSGQPSAQAITVLIADDNVDAAESMALLLRLQNYDVHTAASGKEALELGAALRPDVVILDIGMPKLSGYEVAAQIRQADWGLPTLLIASTGWGQSEDRARSLEAGFDHHLTKPIDLDRLAKILADVKKASQPASA
jgi:CheY-like chemotaxis protein